MKFRLAVTQDLPQLKAVYKDIVQNMNNHQIQIWDDIYPYEFFDEDVKKRQLYVLYHNAELVSAFALCGTNPGEKFVNWIDNHSKAIYLDRLGVNVNYTGKGTGSFMLTQAKKIAKALGAEYLRLFVVDINEPAIRLYTKNNFIKAGGIYDEIFDDGLILHEYGYEAVL